MASRILTPALKNLRAPGMAMRTQAPAVWLAVRPMSTSNMMRHKETETNSPNLAIKDIADQSVKESHKGEGKWRPELATESEEDVKADQAWEKGDKSTDPKQNKTKA